MAKLANVMASRLLDNLAVLNRAPRPATTTSLLIVMFTTCVGTCDMSYVVSGVVVRLLTSSVIMTFYLTLVRLRPTMKLTSVVSDIRNLEALIDLTIACGVAPLVSSSDAADIGF